MPRQTRGGGGPLKRSKRSSRWPFDESDARDDATACVRVGAGATTVLCPTVAVVAPDAPEARGAGEALTLVAVVLVDSAR